MRLPYINMNFVHFSLVFIKTLMGFVCWIRNNDKLRFDEEREVREVFGMTEYGVCQLSTAGRLA